MSPPGPFDERIVVLAPSARDGRVTSDLLTKAGFEVSEVRNGAELCRAVEAGVGAVIVAEEALTGETIQAFSGILARQEPWSDLPVILFTGRRDRRGRLATTESLAPLRNVTLLERPVEVVTLVSAVQAAVRARRRQYDARAAQKAALERLEAASRAKDEFLAILSHELRSPLSAMLGWVGVLRTGRASPEKLQDGLARIERNVRLQAELVNDILDVSRIVAGKLTMAREAVRFESVVGNAVESFGFQAEERGVRLDVETTPLSAAVLGDAARLNQVVTNLVGNALKFTPRGGTVSVTLREIESQAELQVRDTGEGIEPGFLPHLFQRFTQANAAANRRHGGLGLGLSIAHYVVKEHGGTLTAASEGKGKGAVFTVRVPLAAEKARVLPDKLERRRPQPALRDVSVLVVDDEADSREVIALILEEAGCHVRVAGAAREALEALRAVRPDVVVADIGMPGEDGYWLIDELRRIKGLRTLPAIALTGFASRQDQARARGAGYERHLAKPVEPETLIAAIAELTGRRRKPARAAPPARTSERSTMH